MANDNVFIYDHESGLETVREMTDSEQAIRNAEVAAAEAIMAAEKAATEKAATDKEALLAKLGITADEAKLLLS
jgi:hypothetical protein